MIVDSVLKIRNGLTKNAKGSGVVTPAWAEGLLDGVKGLSLDGVEEMKLEEEVESSGVQSGGKKVGFNKGGRIGQDFGI